MSDDWHLAQLNVAVARYTQGDPRIAEFYERLDEINALAEASPGFVWRLQDETGSATGIQVEQDPSLLVNLTVWESVESLHTFVYRSMHQKVMVKRRQWFERPAQPYQVLWWVPAGTVPSVELAMDKLRLMRECGPTQAAFSFQSPFAPPGMCEAPNVDDPSQHCVGWDD